jgi:hypothetical protein
VKPRWINVMASTELGQNARLVRLWAPTWSSRLIAFALIASAGGARAAAEEGLDADRGRFAKLADECRRSDFVRLADTIENWLGPANSAEYRLFRPPASRPAVNANSGAAESNLFAKFIQLRSARAEKLYERARGLSATDPSLAYQLLWAALRDDPEHVAARRALGFEPTDQGWHLPFSAQQIKAGRVWHEKFGWIARDDVPRYEKGERRSGTSWIAAIEDARRHADIRRGWKIETDHYIVTTNHSLEEGARLAAQLERLHHAWRGAFAGYWLTAKELQQRLDAVEGGGRRVEGGKHRVICFRDRGEYVRALKTAQPRIEMSIGVYLDAARTAYFFAGKEQDAGTVLHEATHQLFKETRKPTISPAERPNFWIVEAVACYMESLAAGDEFDVLGRKDTGRLPAARERLLDDGFYVPLAELVHYDAPQLQRDPRVAKIYSQSAGLAAFLMHHEGGRYRPALMKYLQAVYSGKGTTATLANVAGTKLEELDRQYRTFLQADQQSLPADRADNPR